MGHTRDDSFSWVLSQLRGGGSVLITGDRGVGRSHLLARVATHADVAVIRGRETVDGIPFVPFAEVLRRSGLAGAEALEIYQALPRRLATGLLLVDDADELDRASGALLAQTARAGGRLALTARDPSLLPTSLRDALREPGWEFCHLDALPDDEILALATDVLGEPLSPASARRLLDRSCGNAAVARGLLVTARSRGAIATTAAGAVVSAFAPDADALALAGHDLADISPAALREMGRLVVAGSLPWPAMSEELRDELADRGLLRVQLDELVPAGPLVVDAITAAMEGTEAACAAEALHRVPDEDRWRELRQRLAVLAGLDDDAEAVAETARWLGGAGRVEECLALLAGERSDPAALLLRAEARLATGDRSGALTDLDSAAVGARGDQLLELAHQWTYALGGRQSDHVELERRIGEILPRVERPEVREAVAAALDRRRIILGDAGESRTRRTLAGDPITLALRAAMDGDVHTARRLSAPSETALAGDDADPDELMRVLAHFLSLVYDGRLRESREAAELYYRRCLAESRPILGLWAYNRTKIAFHAGQYDDALALGLEARRHLAWQDVTGLAVPAEALIAASAARLGRFADADSVVAAMSDDDRLLPRVAVGVARVEAERLRKAGRVADAATRLHDAGMHAIENAELYSGVLAIDESFMLHPRSEVAGFLDALRDRSALVAAFADRALGIVDRDVDRITQAARALEQMVQPGRAAHCWRVAARLHEAARAEGAARSCLQQASRLAATWRLSAWPDSERARIVTLTPRERQIAEQAAARLRSREIAEQAGLSVRTVDNHLASAFRKLGISRRDQLLEALADLDPR